jgi:hypothetical protein
MSWVEAYAVVVDDFDNDGKLARVLAIVDHDQSAGFDHTREDAVTLPTY